MRVYRTNLLLLAILCAAIALGGYLRLRALDVRPMHGDEANQAVRAGILLDTGEYRYDPDEHHGPTLYYVTLPLIWATGATGFAATTETLFRLVPAAFGVLLLLGTAFLWRPLGPGSATATALLLALSPAFVYYGRYYIQETLFVAFAFAYIVAGHAWLRDGSRAAAATTGIAAGLLFATKETSILVFAASGIALFPFALATIWNRSKRVLWLDRNRIHLALAATAGLAVAVVFFSSFGTNPRGVLDSVRAFSTYADRASGTGSAGIHDKPWSYYLALLAYTYRSAGPRWSEAMILVFAGLGGVRALWPGQNTSVLPRFLLGYTLALTTIYSAIPYKTPWNLLPFYLGWVILAGYGMAWLVQVPGPRVARAAVYFLLALGCWNLYGQALAATSLYAADVRNPYAYAHTSTNALRLVQRIEDLERLHPDGASMRVDVVHPAGDYWPLPWYFRRYDAVGYWNAIPPRLEAPVLIAPPELRPALLELLPEGTMVETYGLRPDTLLHVFIDPALWKTFLDDRVKARPSG